MTRRLRVLVVLVAAWAAAACGNPPAPPAPTRMPRPAVEAVGPVVATVNGEPIGLSEVAATARDTGLSPIAALRRLEQERVLLAHVDDLAADAEAESATRRAAVQAFLRARIEDPIGDAAVDDAEIAARYAATRSAWARPERRRSVHVLATARVAGDEAAPAAAARFIGAAVARLSAAADPAAEADAIGAEAPAGRSFTVRVEHLPPVDRHAAMAEPFLAALFALASAPSVVPEPVTTSFGVHAIVLTGIEPPFEFSIAEATPILRRQLVAEHRAAALDALTTDLATHTTVAVEQRLATAVFAADLGATEP